MWSGQYRHNHKWDQEVVKLWKHLSSSWLGGTGWRSWFREVELVCQEILVSLIDKSARLRFCTNTVQILRRQCCLNHEVQLVCQESWSIDPAGMIKYNQYVRKSKDPGILMCYICVRKSSSSVYHKVQFVNQEILSIDVSEKYFVWTIKAFSRDLDLLYLLLVLRQT